MCFQNIFTTHTFPERKVQILNGSLIETGNPRV